MRNPETRVITIIGRCWANQYIPHDLNFYFALFSIEFKYFCRVRISIQNTHILEISEYCTYANSGMSAHTFLYQKQDSNLFWGEFCVSSFQFTSKTKTRQPCFLYNCVKVMLIPCFGTWLGTHIEMYQKYCPLLGTQEHRIVITRPKVSGKS